MRKCKQKPRNTSFPFSYSLPRSVKMQCSNYKQSPKKIYKTFRPNFKAQNANFAQFEGAKFNFLTPQNVENIIWDNFCLMWKA